MRVSELINPQAKLLCLFAMCLGVLCGLVKEGFADSKHPVLIYPEPGLADITSLDVYTEGQTIHVLVAGKRRGEETPGLAYLRSEDGGYTWSGQAEVPSEVAPATASMRGKDAQIAARGDRLIAVWQTSGEFPGMGPMASAFSADGGKTWTEGPNPADDGSLSDHGYADMGADEAGRFHIVWLDDREENGNFQGLRYARSTDGGRTWSRNQTLDEAACTCCWTRLQIGLEGILHVLYRDANPQDMALFQSMDAGATWRRAGTVGRFEWMFLGCPHTGGGLSMARGTGTGSLHSVVWTGKEGALGLHHLVSKDNGRTWGASRRLSQAAAARGDIAARDLQHLAAVWDEAKRNGSAIIFASSCDGGQSWARPARISAPETVATHPTVLATATGYAVLWTEKQGDGARRLAVAAIEPKNFVTQTRRHE